MPVCDKCHGTGRVPDPAWTGCAPIVIGHETVTCFAEVPHPGEPHMALLCQPCPDCGGYDECFETCQTYFMEPRRDPGNYWFSWRDGDLALTRVIDDDDNQKGQRWRDRFQPSSPWARPVAAA